MPKAIHTVSLYTNSPLHTTVIILITFHLGLLNGGDVGFFYFYFFKGPARPMSVI